MALFERSEFSHFSRCKSPPPPDSDDFPRRRVGQRWAPLPARSVAPSGTGGLCCLAAGEPLVAGRHQAENDDVRPGGRPGITFRPIPACVTFSQRRAAQPAGDVAAA